VTDTEVDKEEDIIIGM